MYWGVSPSVQFSLSVMSDSLRPHESQHARPPCPTPSRSSLRLTSIESGMPSSISSSVVPFSSCPQSLTVSKPWDYPILDALGFLELGYYFLPYFREVFNYYLLKYFLMVFLFVFFFWDSYDSNVGAFNIVLEVSEIVLISSNSFFFFPLWFIYFYHSIFYFTNPIFCLRYSTVGFFQSVFLISFIVLFIKYWLFLFLLGPC